MENNILKPSSAARRRACPGSFTLEKKVPEQELTQSAREGVAAHWVAECIFNRSYENIIGKTDPQGTLITDEIYDAAKFYTDEILKSLEKNSCGRLHIEETLHINSVNENCYGTPDCWAFDPRGNGTIFLWDFKYGHTPVDAFENWQLIEYVAGVIETLGLDGDTVEKFKIICTIVQPRDFQSEKIKVWEFFGTEFIEYFYEARGFEKEALNPDAKCKPNPECSYCTARYMCKALRQAALTAVDVAYENTPLELSPDQLGAELAYLEHHQELLKARIRGLQQGAEFLLRKGKNVLHYSLAPASVRKNWSIAANTVIELGEAFGKNLKKSEHVATPMQAIAAGIPDYVVKEYVVEKPGALKLTKTKLSNKFK